MHRLRTAWLWVLIHLVITSWKWRMFVITHMGATPRRRENARTLGLEILTVLDYVGESDEARSLAAELRERLG